MTHRPRRPEQRKPWPWLARKEYFQIAHLTAQMQADLLELKAQGLGGPKDYLLVADLIPQIHHKAAQVQRACQRYERKKERGFAYWAGWAISNIDLLAGAIRLGLEEAEAAWCAKPRDPLLVADYIDEALEKAERISAEIENGPPPPDTPQDAIEAALAIATQSWGEEE